MKSVLITCGLPGAGYHGGAVTCWAIVKALLKARHTVTVLSLFDVSDFNPYLKSRQAQTDALYDIGAEVEFIEYDSNKLMKHDKSDNMISGLLNKFSSIINPDMEKYFPWAKLDTQVHEKLQKIKPDVIFCYHFDALSTAYNSDVAPIMAGVGDLCHLPVYFRWKTESPSIRKYIIGGSRQLFYSRTYKTLMLKMLKRCRKRGAFAAHYAEWIRKHSGFSDTMYLRTPAHDPLGETWATENREKESVSPLILIIGDLATTSTSSGIEYVFQDVLPDLDREFGREGYKMHLVGGGKPQKNLESYFDHPAVVLRGRIVPSEPEFLRSNLLLVPTPINLGIRVRVITAFSLASCVVAHSANAEGIPEMKHEENCLLADSGKGLSRQVIRALKDRALRIRLGEKARQTYEEFFSENVAGGRIVSEMRKIAVE